MKEWNKDTDQKLSLLKVRYVVWKNSRVEIYSFTLKIASDVVLVLRFYGEKVTKSLIIFHTNRSNLKLGIYKKELVC